jgi:hypothetical protein
VPLVGEWERQTEPYKGMRIKISSEPAAAAESAIVTRASLVPEGRTGAQRAQLECQRSLWKSGDALVTGIRRAAGGYEGTIVIRDWGFSGQCRHADSRASARMTVDGDDRLVVAVTRGKTVTQEWTRVRP